MVSKTITQILPWCMNHSSRGNKPGIASQHFKRLLFSVLSILLLIVGARAQNSNATIELISEIRCEQIGTDNKMEFNIIPDYEAPLNSTAQLTEVEFTSYLGSADLSTLEFEIVAAAEGNIVHVIVPAKGFINYKFKGNFIFEVTNADGFGSTESITVPFDVDYALEDTKIALNNIVTYYNNTSEVKTIKVTNPIDGFTYTWYKTNAQGEPISSVVFEGTSFEVAYEDGRSFYIKAVNESGCILDVFARRVLNNSGPPTPVTSIFTVKQLCDFVADRPYYLIPVRNDGKTHNLTYQWSTLPQHIGTPYQPAENLPLNMNDFDDGIVEVKIIDHTENTSETVRFLLWGSKPTYVGNSPTDLLPINWTERLVIVKQYDKNSLKWNQRLSFAALNYCYRYTKLGIAPHTKVVFASGYLAFNRLVFLDENEIKIGEDVTLTSDCNMWGGIVIHAKCQLSLEGNSYFPITIENANTGVLLNLPDVGPSYPTDWNSWQSFDYPLNSHRWPSGERNNTSILKFDYVNFKNNYYHVYLLQEVRNTSYIHNCNFTSNPDKMLRPYQPDADGNKFQTEACIVGYDGKPGKGIEDQNGFFYKIGLYDEGVNIENCNFSGAFYGILMPFQPIFNKQNHYIGLNKAAIAAQHQFSPAGGCQLNGARIENQVIQVSSELPETLQYQSDNIHNFWNTVNRFTYLTPINPIAPIDIPGFSTEYLTRTGLSRLHPPILDEIGGNPDQQIEPTGNMLTNAYGIHCMNAPVLHDNLYSDISTVVLENNTITGLAPTGSADIIALKTHGAYVGNLLRASKNDFTNLEIGLHCHLDRTGTMQITGNTFYNNIMGIQLTRISNPDRTIDPTIQFGCNTFDFDRNIASVLRTGISIEKGANVGIIKGSLNPAYSNTYFSCANVWPIANETTRSSLPRDNTNRIVNVENPTYGWDSPPLWTSLANNTIADLVSDQPQEPYRFFYNRYSNEFVGNISSSVSTSIRLRVLNSNVLSFTSEANGNLSGSQYEEVCNSILTGTTIAFPTSYSQNGNEPKPESDITISQAFESGTITISLPENYSDYFLTITDLLGRKIENKKGNASTETNLNFNLPNKGIYLVSIETQGEIHTSKIIVK